MRLFWLLIAVVCGCGATSADPGKIIVDDANKVDDKRWKPYDVRLHNREERVHGDVIVLSPPLFVRGPPKGFPFRVRTKRASSYSHGYRLDDRGALKIARPESTSFGNAKGTFRAKRAGTYTPIPITYDFQKQPPRTKRSPSHASGRQNRLPDVYPQYVYPRNPLQSGRVQGEVIVHSSTLSVKGPPKGYPLRRKTRQASTPQQNSNVAKTSLKKPITVQAVTSKPAKQLSSSSALAPTKSSNSTINSRRGQGTNLKPAKGRQSMMKRLKKMWPYMFIPTMMTLGYAPFVLSTIKMFVMNALMFNLMAFNAAIMLTLRNVVFGPRTGGHTKYVNYGYKHHGHEGRR